MTEPSINSPINPVITNNPSIRSLNGKPLSSQSENKIKTTHFFIYLSFSIIAGISIGYAFTRVNPPSSTKKVTKTTSNKVAGIVNKKTFKDQAEGVLRKGGIDGEGNFHLERPGGESQNVYLTSTTIDLNEFVGKKVRVWGETFTGEKAGWLMDVGLIEIL